MEITEFQEFLIGVTAMLVGSFIFTAPLRKIDKENKEYYKQYFEKHNIASDYL